MRDSKNLVIGMLCAVVCIMAVAYAAFSTTLTITTNTSIDSNWCVKIKEVSCDATPVAGGAESITVGDETVNLAATYTTAEGSLSTDINMTFIQPGDTGTCEVTYANCGTLAAKITHVVSSVEMVEGEEKLSTLTANEQGAIIYTNADDSIRFTITGADEENTLAAKAGDTATYGGETTITIVGEYINVPGGQGTASDTEAKIKIVSSASQSV